MARFNTLPGLTRAPECLPEQVGYERITRAARHLSDARHQANMPPVEMETLTLFDLAQRALRLDASLKGYDLM